MARSKASVSTSKETCSSNTLTTEHSMSVFKASNAAEAYLDVGKEVAVMKVVFFRVMMNRLRVL